jgi:hypothetical protein
VALDWKTVGIPFVGGLETKADDKTVLPTKLLVLNNGEFTRRGTVRTRPGHFALSNATLQGTTLLGEPSVNPVGTKLGHAIRADELMLLTDERIYSADETTGRWIDKGQHFPLTHTLQEMAQVNSNQAYGSIATAGGIRVVCWYDSRGSVRYSVYNAVTDAALALDQAVSGTNSRPWVVPVGQNVLLLWADHTANAINGLLIRSSNPIASLAETPVEFVGDLDTGRRYAVATDGTDVFISYMADGGVIAAGVGVARITPAGVTLWKVSVSTDVPTALDVAYSSASDQVNVCWYDGSQVKRRLHFAPTGAASGAVTLGIVADVAKVATGPNQTSVTDFAHAWEVTGASSDLNAVTIVDTDSSNTTVQHAFLASSGFQFKEDGRCFFLLGHSSRTGLQGSYYLYSDQAVLAGQLLYQTAASRPALDHLTRCFNNEVALGFKRQLDAQPDVAVFTHDGVSLCTLNPLPAPSSAEAGGTAYLSGSCLWAYDGQGVTEANLCMYPDMLAADLAQSNTGAGDLTAVSQYSYRVYYEVPRANGERVRSAALVVSITLTGANDTVTLTLPSLAHTRWRDDLDIDETASNVSVVVYRTIGNDTTGIYYQVTDSNPANITGDNRFVYNNPLAPTMTLVDSLGDDDLVGRAVDYISRGELEHIPPPGPSLVCGVADRIFVAGGGVPKGTVRFSKLRFFGEPAQFSDLLVIDDLPEGPGGITSLSFVNETLVALRQYGISAVVGQGVDNTGSSGGYESQAITTDVGCSGVSTVTPDGVMFSSPKGIYLLDQSFNVSYIGAAVERYNGQTLTGACVIPGTNQVLFLTSDTGNDDRSLMYDYYFKEWAAWTVRGTSLVVWQQTTPTFLSTDGLSLYRDVSDYDSAIFTDAGSTYDFRLRTGRLRLTDCLQDFARLRKFMVLGTYRSPHLLLVDLFYDRDTAPYESITWDPATVIETSTWGSDATWGSGDFWGGSRDGATYQFEHKPMRQKFSTISFQFSMIPGTTPGAGYELTELALQCGVKPGLQRLGATRKY